MSMEATGLEKEELIDLLESDLDQIEPGLKFFDKHLPSVLGEEIDILALDKNDRLALLIIETRKLSAQMAAATALHLYYLWNFVCDFRADFRAEALEQKQIELAHKPPRLILVAREMTPLQWSYLKLMKDMYIRISIYTYARRSVDGVENIHFSKTAWPKETKHLTRAKKYKFDLAYFRHMENHEKSWKQIVTMEPTMAGYDKEKRLRKLLL